MSVVICRRAAFIASFSLAHVGGRSGIKRPVIRGGGMSLLLFLSLVSFFHPSFFLSLSVAGCSEREREGGGRDFCLDVTFSGFRKRILRCVLGFGANPGLICVF